MQFTESNRYPFPAHAVVQVFGNKDYFIKKYTGAGATNIQVLEEQHNGSKTRIAVSRHVDIQFKGMPAVVKCDMTLTDEDGRCVLNLNFSVNINVPLIGDKLAKVLGADLKKKFERDSHQAQEVMAEFVQRYL